MRCRIAETQAGQGQLDVANGRNADVLRLRLEGIREELYAAQIVAQDMAGELERLSCLPASKGVVGGRVSGATPVPGDATVSPGENSIQPCETASRNARRPVDRSSGTGELENARETESRGDVGRVPLGRAHNPSPRGPRLLDDREQYESAPEIPDVRL